MMKTDGIAIVGMSGRFPDAPDIDTYWRNIEEGRESVSRFPFDELELDSVKREGFDRAGYVCARGVLDDVDRFDARFFGYLPRDAELMDPQQRIFLEICWEAIERAGYDTQRYPGAIGVFAGSFMNSYLLANLCSNPRFLAQLVESFQSEALKEELGNDKDYLATHVAFKLGLRGPAHGGADRLLDLAGRRGDRLPEPGRGAMRHGACRRRHHRPAAEARLPLHPGQHPVSRRQVPQLR